MIAVPIGHPDDIGARARKLLAEVDCLAAEDTRVAGRMLAQYGIKRRIVSYHEHNAAQRKHELLSQLMSGRDVALISDAGTPLISDPGWGLVQLAVSSQIAVLPIPGPCALIAALISSGLPCHEFCFSGYVPRKPAQRLKLWQKLLGRDMTTVVYLSPHILADVLNELGQYLPNCPVVLHKEITKSHEKVWRDLPEKISQMIQKNAGLSKGEFVLVIGAPTRQSDNDAMQI